MPVPDPEPIEPTVEPVPELPPERQPERPFWKRILVPLALWLIAIGLGVVAATLYLGRGETATPAQVNEAIDEVLSTTTLPPDRGPAIYGTIIQSVVFIQVGEPGAEGGSIGTGVVINADGTIMTSNHVVDGGEPIRVIFPDGTRSEAQIVESRPEMDIATIAATTLPQVVVPAVLGGSVPIGAEVYAVGNPLGLGGSFSEGVVSGLDRTLPLEGGQELENLIQFDAAVNPGSSGGPLVNSNAQVVGIVTALVNPTGSDFFAGIGFAVPIETAGGAAGGPEQ
jgi:S1-C subfamily serine protease